MAVVLKKTSHDCLHHDCPSSSVEHVISCYSASFPFGPVLEQNAQFLEGKLL